MSAPRITDLRSYLKALEEVGELSRVKIPVSLDQEIGAICLRNLRGNGPGLLFEHPGDGNLPLAAEWDRRTSTPLTPVVVEREACQQNVMIGKDVDLSKLPAPIWNEFDGEPY